MPELEALVPVRIVALATDGDTVDLEACTLLGCQLGELRASIPGHLGGGNTADLVFAVDRTLPRCAAAR